MSKSFYCDYCGSQVNPDQKRCPSCGRFFRAVRCPLCAYTGEGKEFAKGCPRCGYLSLQTCENHKEKKREFFLISRIFAYGTIAFLTVLLIYLFTLLKSL